MAVSCLVEGFNNMSTIIMPAIENQINVLRNEVSCTAMRGQFFTELNRRLTQEIYLTVTSGLNALYNGRITPDFMPPSKIRDSLMTRDDMKGSIYQSDPTLIYQLGKFILMSVSHVPFAISGILILPRLLKEYVGVVLSINRVPMVKKNGAGLHILKSEDLAVKEISSQKLWTPNFDTCIKHTGTYYCPLHEMRAKYSQCLTELLYSSNGSACEYIDAQGYPLVKQSNAGLLVSSTVSEYVSIAKDSDGNRKSDRKEMPNFGQSNFLTVREGMEIMVNHDIYMLAAETAEIIIKINDTIYEPDFTIENTTIPELDPITPPDVFVPHYLSMSWSYSEMAILMGLTLIIFYLYTQIIVLKNEMNKLTSYTQNVSYHRMSISDKE